MIYRGTVDDFADDDSTGFVILEITRECIEAGYVASTLEKLHALTDTRERILKFRECVAFSVTGYNEDPRELFEIAEVRNFFRALTQEWPHWLWFLNRETGMVNTLAAILCAVTSVDKVSGRVNCKIEPPDLADMLKDFMVRGNPLFRLNSIPQKDMQDSLTSAMKALGMSGL